MEIKGLQRTSLIDYPDKISCVVFLGRCNFRCPFCQNPELVLYPEKEPTIPEGEFFNFLENRKGLLDSVVITGGEPCLHKELPAFISKIKEKGFSVKLDTNGYNPELLKQVINERLADYIAMDIKSDKEKYAKASGTKNLDIKRIEESIILIRKSKIPYEFRSTIVPKIFNEKTILNIGKWLKGSEKFCLQQFRTEKTIDPDFKKINPYPKEKLEEFAEKLRRFFKEVEVRN